MRRFVPVQLHGRGQSCSQEELRQMRKEIVNILSKYLNLDSDRFEVRMDIVYEIKQGVQDVKTIQIK